MFAKVNCTFSFRHERGINIITSTAPTSSTEAMKGHKENFLLSSGAREYPKHRHNYLGPHSAFESTLNSSIISYRFSCYVEVSSVQRHVKLNIVKRTKQCSTRHAASTLSCVFGLWPGFPKFVPLKELFDGRFINDDAIYFKVHVDISRLTQQHV